MSKKSWTCPKCGKVTDEYPAISRIDNTEICSDCGTREALETICSDDKTITSIINEIHNHH